ncbi:ABC transporter ATP-binding protein [Methyloversatilis thermotolerans]|uniref:ABC transporter ATP-binding protein n=1 Tax=Methyloversatilis thermotolerans TaxID=1346290 RepID=UPI0003636F41|nr:ABC transporter ATP-binding protein [Methyloversatilis thermotolerans]
MLEVRHLNKRYANGVKALDDIDVRLAPGVFGLLGPNGAGKSSLMRTLATLQLPDSGSIRLDGVDVLAHPDEARKRIGYLPQEFGLYPHVSAQAMLEQFALYKGVGPARARRDLAHHLLQQVNLYDARERHLGGFSGGMRQRLGIAQALIGDPALLIIDEPTAGLDPGERMRLQNLLAELAGERVVLLSTHIVEDVQALATEVGVMRAGRLVRRGRPADLLGELRGRVWSGRQNAGDPLDPDRHVISRRVLGGVQHVRVLADACPGPGFHAADADLDDVFFTAIGTH